MTGGTGEAANINKNLARVAQEFGLGMGLGSCRTLLDSDDSFKDFDLKGLMPDAPLLANFGIAQLEKALLNEKVLSRMQAVLEKLRVDGVIVHINPTQEWLQPEGDRLVHSPLEVIAEFLEKVDYPVIVKEVGQGMGPKSLEQLMRMPLAAIEFGAFGGTNFAKLESLRSTQGNGITQAELTNIGHTAQQMVEIVNDIKRMAPHEHFVDNFIISGGVKSFLDGFYLCEKLNACAIYGQAKMMLDHAADDYNLLANFVDGQVKGLEFATSYLTVR